MNRTHGNRYEATKGMALTEVAKILRKEIKAAYPAFKVSVRVRNVTHSKAIDIDVTAVPFGFEIHNPEWVRWDCENPREVQPGWMRRLSPAAEGMIKDLECRLSAFNYDGSDTNSDYWDVRFYAHVRFGWELEKADKARAVAALSALPKAPAVDLDEDAEVLRRGFLAEVEARRATHGFLRLVNAPEAEVDEAAEAEARWAALLSR